MEKLLKKAVIDSLKITEKTKNFLKNIKTNYGEILINTKKKDIDEPDFIGWGRLSDGTVVNIRGNTIEKENKLCLSIQIVEVPNDLLEEEYFTINSLPNYKKNL